MSSSTPLHCEHWQGRWHTSNYSVVTTRGRDASTLPYKSSVSYFTVTVNVSDLPESFKSFSTRHEYPHVPSQPNGMIPSATFLPDESVTVTTGSKESGLS
jgi:hypothetical protein